MPRKSPPKQGPHEAWDRLPTGLLGYLKVYAGYVVSLLGRLSPRRLIPKKREESWRKLGSLSKDLPPKRSAYERAFNILPEYLAWLDEPYDGVLGVLPEWVPNDTQDRFIGTRCRLLADYPHAELLVFLETWGIRVKSRSGWQESHTLIPKEIRSDIALLHHIKQAVALGMEEGLRLLAGEQIASDTVRFKRISDGGRKGHETAHGTAAEKERRWKEYKLEVERQHELDPTLSYETLCDRVAKKFGVHKETIKRNTTNPRKK